MYPITYQTQESFTVHLHDRDLVFSIREKLYVADFDVERMVAVTMEHTMAEEARARRRMKLYETVVTLHRQKPYTLYRMGILPICLW